jgi:hypothetical protein
MHPAAHSQVKVNGNGESSTNVRGHDLGTRIIQIVMDQPSMNDNWSSKNERVTCVERTELTIDSH